MNEGASESHVAKFRCPGTGDLMKAVYERGRLSVRVVEPDARIASTAFACCVPRQVSDLEQARSVLLRLGAEDVLFVRS